MKSIVDFGADPTGSRDSAPAIQAAMDVAAHVDPAFRTLGIARAWANYRATDPPEQLWALHDDEHSLTVFASLEEALANRAIGEHATATVQPCEIAMPTIDAEDLISRINDHGPEHFPADWGMDYHDHGDCELIELPRDPHAQFPDEVTDAILDELTDALSNAFAAWARKHVGFGSPGKVSIQAWNFTGPARRFAIWSRGKPIEGPFNAVAASGHDWWIELCPRTIAHGIHHCTLQIGHAGNCDPEIR